MSHHGFNRCTAFAVVVLAIGVCPGQPARAADVEQKTAISPAISKTAATANAKPATWIFFMSDRKIGMIQPDGTNERYLDFPAYKQLQWQPTAAVLSGPGRIVFRSSEPPRDPKASFYDKNGAKYAKSHLWWYDLASDAVHAIELPTLMGVVGVLPGGKRMLVAGEEDPDNTNTRIYTVNLDGAEKRQFHQLAGFCYGITLSPDGKKVAFHNASKGYKIYVIDLDTGKQTLIGGEPQYLNFGPEWSPDGQWILYQRCLYKDDPMHQHSDVCIARADGSGERQLTTGQRHWFGTSYGRPDNPGRGSNVPHWSPDGRWITYTRCAPGAQTAWAYQKDRPDTDHFNCVYAPDQARGGSQICLIDVQTGAIRDVTPLVEKQWVWRTAWSPDSTKLVYARAMVDEPAELWTVNLDGSAPRFLTRGSRDQGADFPMWNSFGK